VLIPTRRIPLRPGDVGFDISQGLLFVRGEEGCTPPGPRLQAGVTFKTRPLVPEVTPQRIVRFANERAPTTVKKAR
jgi:hypothetical protein